VTVLPGILADHHDEWHPDMSVYCLLICHLLLTVRLLKAALLAVPIIRECCRQYIN
jgi:hypothetical protein